LDISKIRVEFQPKITDDQLWDFYVRNNICEVGFGKEIAVKPLRSNCIIVGAFYEDKLVGFVRAFFDGVSAMITEFCLELELQGENLEYKNGSLIESDIYGIGSKIGNMLVAQLRKMENTFVSAYIVSECEEAFYSSFGMYENTHHKVFIIDERPYVK
jgi:hypothetical protein